MDEGGITDIREVKKHAELLDAKRGIWVGGERIAEEPDYMVQVRALAEVYKVKGRYIDKKEIKLTSNYQEMTDDDIIRLIAETRDFIERAAQAPKGTIR
jgi:hypothetical protein